MPCIEGPPLNTDVSGIGVRISFYLQTVFLTCLSLRSDSPEEITGALYTLLATNTATAVAALILGLKPRPEISFHDALVIMYLLFLSWVSVCFSMTACPASRDHYGKRRARITLLQLFSHAQSYAIFAFVLAVLATAPTFGNMTNCNANALVVIFRPFSALKSGRIVGWTLWVAIIALYTGMSIRDYLPPIQPVREWIKRRIPRRMPILDDPPAGQSGVAPEFASPEEPSKAQPESADPAPEPIEPRPHSPDPSEYDLPIPWELVLKILLVVVIWSVAVMHIELLIRWNHFAPVAGQSQWQFGQILPMFLIIVPFMGLIDAFGPKSHSPSKGTESRSPFASAV